MDSNAPGTDTFHLTSQYKCWIYHVPKTQHILDVTLVPTPLSLVVYTAGVK